MPTSDGDYVEEGKGGSIMDLLDGVIMATMGVLVVLFARLAVLDWPGSQTQDHDTERAHASEYDEDQVDNTILPAA